MDSNKDIHERIRGKYEHRFKRRFRRHHSPAGRVLGGIILVLVGVVYFMKTMGIIFPSWLFTFPMLLIMIGIFVGAKRLFRGIGWLIITLIGVGLLADRIFPGMSITHFFWPAVIILFGLGMIFNSKRKRWGGEWDEWKDCTSDASVSSEDRLDSTAIFGGVKKNVISKNFKGGEVTCIFGGAEINLQQADIQGTVTIELTQVFGGAKLTIPSNWKVRHDATTTILGGLEDNRVMGVQEDETKILILRGTVIFGGVEINSY